MFQMYRKQLKKLNALIALSRKLQKQFPTDSMLVLMEKQFVAEKKQLHQTMKKKAIRGKYKVMFFPNLFFLKSPAVLLDEWIREQANRKQQYLAKLKDLRRFPGTLETYAAFIPTEMLDYAVYLESKKTRSIDAINAYYNTPQSKQELIAKVLWAIKHDSYKDREAYFDDVKKNGKRFSEYAFYCTYNDVKRRYSFFRIEHGKILQDYVDDGYLYTRIYEITSIKWCYKKYKLEVKLLSTVINVN